MVFVALLGPTVYQFTQALLGVGRLPRWLFLLSLIIPAVTIVLMLGPWHELVITNYGLKAWHGGVLLTYENGPWFQYHSVWIRLHILAVLLLLWLNMRTLHAFHRTRNVLIIISIFVPALVDSIAVYQSPELRFIQIVPTCFAFTSILLAYALFGRNMLEVVPIARSKIVEHLPDSFLMLDTKHHLLDFNPAATRNLGLESQHLGHPIQSISTLPLELRSPERWGIPFELSPTPNVTWLFETHEVLSGKGETIGRIITLRDITALKRVERELKGINHVKTTFMGILAHDLAGNVSSIALNSEILMRDHKKLSGEDLEAMARAIQQSARDVNDFIRQLTDWARTQFDAVKPTLHATDLQELAHKVSEYLAPLSIEKNLEIKFSDLDEARLNCDSRMIETVLRNLMANAIKFSPQGSTVHIRSWQQNSERYVQVHDQGRELPVERLNEFFANPTAGASGTQGLGLLLCRAFVSLHGGRIWAEKAEDGTSLVIFRLPA